MEDFRTLYIVANTPTIAENALLRYFWHSKKNFKKYYRSYDDR